MGTTPGKENDHRETPARDKTAGRRPYQSPAVTEEEVGDPQEELMEAEAEIEAGIDTGPNAENEAGNNQSLG